MDPPPLDPMRAAESLCGPPALDTVVKGTGGTTAGRPGTVVSLGPFAGSESTMIDCGAASSDFGSTKVSADTAVPAVHDVVAGLSSFQVSPDT